MNKLNAIIIFLTLLLIPSVYALESNLPTIPVTQIIDSWNNPIPNQIFNLTQSRLELIYPSQFSVPLFYAGAIYMNGELVATQNWVSTNYYNKSTIDSWNLIKNYVLSSDLDANGNSLLNANTVSSNNINTNQICLSGNCITSWQDVVSNINSIQENDTSVVVTDTGDGSIEFTEDGVQVVYINNQKIGIGTNSPVEKLDVRGNIISQDIYPLSDNSYSLGKSTALWNTLYVSRICLNSDCSAVIYWDSQENALVIKAPNVVILRT